MQLSDGYMFTALVLYQRRFIFNHLNLVQMTPASKVSDIISLK